MLSAQSDLPCAETSSSISSTESGRSAVCGFSASEGTKLANPPLAASSSSFWLEPVLEILPWRTDIRTAVLKPLGNRRRSLMIT